MIVHNASAHRFESYSDDVLAGYVEYTERGKVRDFAHTYTVPRFRGRGVAAEVVEAALQASRNEGFSVIPTCWYVDEFIAAHREYADLL